ncbi:ABC transporter permease [Bogoriella caseilytica]|uniref:ABC-2 type transport system permease protein n=1 Tax=Bogoriella caseilytica TaxID=56055 RepID=A0A3N2BDB7_9MICO|nr:ABC transporter permease [Bogoriella caseilytica]ROR73236.1 ABC-2 type transport system permease protein [Bogoriella caseilytica]
MRGADAGWNPTFAEVVRAFAVGASSQVRQMRGNPDWFLAMFTAPLLTAVFVTIFLAADRGDLTAYGVLAPALICLFQMSLQTAGELISRERENGSLEALLAAPVPFAALLMGRIAAVTAISMVGFAESWLVGWVLTGTPVPIAHPEVFAVTVALTAVAMTGWAGVMSCVFVLARSARTFQNSLSYPFYLLGGVLVPVALLPAWAEVPSRLVFLSWSSDLLRDALTAEPVLDLPLRLAALAVLAGAGYALTAVLLSRTLRRVRATGRLTHA